MLKNHFAEDYRGHTKGKNRGIILIKAICRLANAVNTKTLILAAL